jgi:hypothetical protein
MWYNISALRTPMRGFCKKTVGAMCNSKQYCLLGCYALSMGGGLLLQNSNAVKTL